MGKGAGAAGGRASLARLRRFSPSWHPADRPGAMAEAFLLISKLLFALTAAGTGVHLARLGRSGEGSALHARASAMIAVGGVGLLGVAVAPALAAHGAALGKATLIASDALERTALLLLAAFVWSVFGQGRLLRRLLLVAVVLAILGDWVQFLVFQQGPEADVPRLSLVSSQLCFALPFAWCAVETGLAYLRSRRQRALGLAEPRVTNRFLLWSLGCGCLVGICAGEALGLAAGAGAPLAGAIPWVRGSLYLAIVGVFVLAFAPPASYRRWLESGARGA